jgi:hypothetical protein
MNRIPSVLAMVLVCVTAAGCASSGTDYDPAAVATLMQGMTEAEVIQRLGKPNNVTTMVDGRKVMVWAHSEVNGLSGRSSTRAVSILFGADGRMSRQVSETNSQGSF